MFTNESDNSFATTAAVVTEYFGMSGDGFRTHRLTLRVPGTDDTFHGAVTGFDGYGLVHGFMHDLRAALRAMDPESGDPVVVTCEYNEYGDCWHVVFGGHRLPLRLWNFWE